jgi:hypothetical protein
MTSGARRVTLRPSSSKALTLDVRQGAGARTAIGTFRFTDGTRSGTDNGFGRTDTSIEMVTLGVLQVTDRWASFTGRGRRLPANEDVALAVVVERTNPAKATGATVTVFVDGARRVEMTSDPAAVDIQSQAGRPKTQPTGR